jgi:nucleoid DNA-binding protein
MGKAAKPAGKKSGGKKAMTKSQFVAHLADKAGLSKKQIDAILGEIVDVVKAQVSTKGAGKFVFPGLARFTLKHKPAVKGGETKRNPLTGQDYVTKDKPESWVIRARAVKSLQS